jgi:hypothetical protein
VGHFCPPGSGSGSIPNFECGSGSSNSNKCGSAKPCCWKVAPYNFIMYNAVPGNVASHGTHPRYTHFLVNLPLLFGPLAPIFVVSAANWLVDICCLPWTRKPGVRTVYALTLSAGLVPLLVLSLVKHQEARFLLPLLPCVVLMCAHKLRSGFFKLMVSYLLGK